ncbi:MAG: T9SS type A sorting domain-containing protein, partial [Cytophagales bacterium]|nr:T9SS type A sorting domain-containing protein [Cytophagales bacterium]
VGVFDVTLTALGCLTDSTITMAGYIIVNPIYTITTPDETICDGDSVLIGGIYRKTAGTYYDTLPTINSCDSVIATTLVVNPTYSFSTPDDTICDGDSVIIFSTVRKTAGTYYDTLPTINSCDSVIATTLIVNPTYSINTPNDTICDGDSVLIGGVYRKTAGTYYDTLVTTSGCDSVIVTTLTVDSVYSSAITAAICPGDSFQLPGGTWQTIAGTYYDSLVATNGCDSVVTTDLTVHPAMTAALDSTNESSPGAGDGIASVSVSGGTPPYTYLWNDSLGQTTDTATGLSAGIYTVEVTDSNGCILIGSITVGVQTGISSGTGSGSIDFYPNPASTKVTFVIKLPTDNYGSLKLYNLQGVNVATVFENKQLSGKFTVQFDVDGLAEGVYLYRLVTNDHVVTEKMVVVK